MQLIPWTGAEPIPTSVVSDTLRQEGYAITAHPVSKITPDIPTTNDKDESFWVVKGKIEVNLANQTATLNAGDRLLVPKSSKYRVKVLTDSAFYLLGKKIK